MGTYLRVVRTGSIQAGDHIHRIFVPAHGVTIGKWFSDPTVEDMEALRDADADGEIRLQPEYHQRFEKLQRRLGVVARAGAGVRKLTAAVGPSVTHVRIHALHLKYPPLRKSLIPAQFLRQDW